MTSSSIRDQKTKEFIDHLNVNPDDLSWIKLAYIEGWDECNKSDPDIVKLKKSFKISITLMKQIAKECSDLNCQNEILNAISEIEKIYGIKL